MARNMGRSLGWRAGGCVVGLMVVGLVGAEEFAGGPEAGAGEVGEAGWWCSSNMDCRPGDYCAKAAGDCFGLGECRARPEVCILVFDPVCGCNGLTYGNSCEAAGAGVNVAYPGFCLMCGDRFCDAARGEDSCTCPMDCGPPPASETLCNDGVDNDCDGLVDSDDGDCAWARADFDRDGDVDQADFGHLQACLSGADVVQGDPDCQDARLDGDVDVDEDDVAVFVGCASGPNVPADVGCAG